MMSSIGRRNRVGCVAVLCLMVSACAESSHKSDPMSATLRDLKVVQKRLLVGPDTLRIEIVDLKNERALIRFVGSSDMLGGKTLVAKVGTGVSGLATVRRYSVPIAGRDKLVLYSRMERSAVRWRYLGISHGRRPLRMRANRDPGRLSTISAEGLAKRYRRQRASGELSFTDYKRSTWTDDLKKYMASQMGVVSRSCGLSPKMDIPWERLTDAMIVEHGRQIIQPCAQMAADLETICREYSATKRPPIKKVIDTLKVLKCDPTGGKRATLEGGTVHFSTTTNKPARLNFLTLEVSPQETMGQALLLAASPVCVLGDHQLIIRNGNNPRYAGGETLCYGKGGAFKCTGRLMRYSMAKCRAFYDPRHTTYDGGRMRSKACVGVDWNKGTCLLRCGDGDAKTLKLMPSEQAQALQRKATFEDAPRSRVPHALARDKRGVYYYVDRSAKKGEKNYRVFIGRRGKLIRQRMVDAVDDSEGQLFETARGKLRLLLGKSAGSWVERRRSRTLILVPINKNMPLIHRELGVYWGKRHHTPCDDF